jgi:NRPS condensation-like uncharacterized protein
MKRSDVMKELLKTYYSVNGRCVNDLIVNKANKMIKQYEREEFYEVETAKHRGQAAL